MSLRKRNLVMNLIIPAKEGRKNKLIGERTYKKALIPNPNWAPKNKNYCWTDLKEIHWAGPTKKI